MQAYAKLALLLAAVCGLLTIGINVLMVLVITINMFIPDAVLPVFYYEFLHFPFFSLFLPIVAIAALVPLALKFALSDNVTLPTFHLVEHEQTSTINHSSAASAESHLLKVA